MCRNLSHARPSSCKMLELPSLNAFVACSSCTLSPTITTVSCRCDPPIPEGSRPFKSIYMSNCMWTEESIKSDISNKVANKQVDRREANKTFRQHKARHCTLWGHGWMWSPRAQRLTEQTLGKCVQSQNDGMRHRLKKALLVCHVSLQSLARFSLTR